MNYLHTYRAPSGEWSGKVLEEVAGVAGCEDEADVWEAASEQFDVQGLPPSATTVPVEVPEEFGVWCREHGVTPADLLATFAADLLGIENEHGIAAHALAATWFEEAVLPAAGDDVAASLQSPGLA